MNLDYLEPKLNANTWQDLFDDCYRMRYSKEHYQKIPASYGGDCGIEGFTRNGIVLQCYYRKSKQKR